MTPITHRKRPRSVVVSLIAATCLAFVVLSVGSSPRSLTNELGRQLGEDSTQSYNHYEHAESHEFTNKDLTSIVCLVLSIIGMTIIFEVSKGWLHEHLLSDMQLLLEKLYGELTVLGFISMICFSRMMSIYVGLINFTYTKKNTLEMADEIRPYQKPMPTPWP